MSDEKQEDNYFYREKHPIKMEWLREYAGDTFYGIELPESLQSVVDIGKRIIALLTEPTHRTIQRHIDLESGLTRYVLVESFNGDFEYDVTQIVISVAEDRMWRV